MPATDLPLVALPRPLSNLPGWWETPVGPRLYRLDHESGSCPPVFYRSVGWRRPQVFVMVNGREKPFGTIPQACAWAELPGVEG